MKKTGVLLLLLASLLTGCGSNLQSDNGQNQGFVSADGSSVLHDIAARGDAVEATGQLTAGGSWQLSSLRGKVVLLNSWGPWCAPCRAELPALQKLQTEFGSKGLQVVGLATRTNAVSVAAFVKQAQINYPQVADYDSAIVAGLGTVPAATIPGTVLIDRAGRIAGWSLGAADASLLRSLVESLLEEKP